jgi:hypothetical protein
MLQALSLEFYLKVRTGPDEGASSGNTIALFIIEIGLDVKSRGGLFLL